MRILGLFFLFLFATVDMACAQYLGTSTGTGTCPYGTGVADGCPGSPANGNFQQSNFFTYARQSSQAAYSGRPSWNVACVDYKCGYDTTLTLKDPSTASLPTGCAYTTNLVRCQSTSANATFNGFDWTKPNGCTQLQTQASFTGTITISNSYIAGLGTTSTGGAVGTGCRDFYWARLDGGAGLTLTTSFFDGSLWLQSFSGAVGLISTPASNFPITQQYNVFKHFPRVTGISGTGDITLQYNYYEDFNYTYAQIKGYQVGTTLTVTQIYQGQILTQATSPGGNAKISDGSVLAFTTNLVTQLTGSGGASCPDPTCNGLTGTYQVGTSATVYSVGSQGSFFNWNGTHGEKDAAIFTGTVVNYKDQFETVLLTPNDSSFNAPITMFLGGSEAVTNASVDHNVVVTNVQTGATHGTPAAPSAGTNIYNIGFPVTTNLTLSNNWGDATGASLCFSGSGTVTNLTFASNISLIDGTTLTYNNSNCPGHN